MKSNAVFRFAFAHRRPLTILALIVGALVCAVPFCAPIALAAADAPPATDVTKAFIDGQALGWRDMQEDEFTNVNCDPDTWKWKEGVIYCTGNPTGVLRTKNKITNFELVVQWRLMRYAGNSGVFVWGTEESIAKLRHNQLPDGIEVQVLDHGYKEDYEKHGRKADWFTTNGDVFPCGKSDMKPFPPIAPDHKRAFPRKNLSKGWGQWNHYYVRAINGEIRLWVNGEEVSGGNHCNPASGYLCLESEGAPVEFKNLRIRELP